MRNLLLNCKKQGQNNEFFTEAIDRILNNGKKLKRNDIRWLQLIQNEILHLQRQNNLMNKQYKMSVSAQDEKSKERMMERLRKNVEANTNLLQIFEQLKNPKKKENIN